MRLLILAMVLAGCSNEGDEDKEPQDTQNPDDTDTDETDSPVEDTGPQPFDSSFTTGRFKISKLLLIGETDVDDDGEVDNNLPNALNTVDILMAAEDFSLDAFNLRMQTNIDSYTTIVLTDARKVDLDVEVDLLQGQADSMLNLSINPNSYTEGGEPRVQFRGHFLDEQLMWAETDSMTIPISFYEGGAPLPVTLEKARFEGALTSELFAGELMGVLPIDELIDKVIDPLIPDSGYDYDSDGDVDAKQDILDLIWSIAPAAGDVELGPSDTGGTRTGVSCRFTFQADPATWAR